MLKEETPPPRDSLTCKTLKISPERGFTFIENLVAITIVVLFFAALFAVNAQCLSMLNASRGAALADTCLQDRIEQLRTCTWSQLTDADYLQSSIFNTATNGAANLGQVTESVRISAYPVAVNPPINVVRSNGAASVVSSNAALVNGDLVQVETLLSWNAGGGGRSRTQATTTLIAKTP